MGRPPGGRPDLSLQTSRSPKTHRLCRSPDTFAEPVDISELRALPGVRDVEADGRRVRFSVATAALDPVIKVIARHEIVDLELAHPSLEEIFLTYYAREEHHA